MPGALYCAVGEAGRGAAYVRHYYTFMGPMGEQMAAALPNTRPAIEEVLKAAADAGMDEFILWPTVPDLDQIDRLAEITAAR